MIVIMKWVMILTWGALQMTAKTIDWDIQTSNLLASILDGALTASKLSGIPIDPKLYNSIEKIKLLTQCVGTISYKEN